MKVKIIIAGGREFKDYKLLKERCDYYLSNAVKNGYEIEIVSGTARGADKLGERYAKERGYKIAYFPADWKAHGKAGGYKRNEQMSAYSDALIAFWDKNSRGTKHMIDIAKRDNLHVRIVNY